MELAPTLVRHYGEPYADSSAIPSFYLAELTRRHVTVALNGDGGDESFAGYLRHPANALTAWVDHLPVAPRRSPRSSRADGIDSRERRSAQVYARRYLTTLGRCRHASATPPTLGSSTPPSERCADPRCGCGGRPCHEPIGDRQPWEAASGDSRLDVLLQTDVETYLPGDLLTKIDIATMAYSLEARSPLLDFQLMELAASVPARYKAALGSTRSGSCVVPTGMYCRMRSSPVRNAALGSRSAIGSEASCESGSVRFS